MAKKQNVKSRTSSTSGLPTAPRIYMVNSICASNVYAEALNSLIPTQNKSVLDHKAQSMSLWSDHSTPAEKAGRTAKSCQTFSLQEGRNMVSVALCNESTFDDFSSLAKSDWPLNHIIMRVDGFTPYQVAERIIKWLFSVLSVRETLYLIPESKMLDIDAKNFPDYAYCALADMDKQSRSAKVQAVALIASRPEITRRNKLTWDVVDRSGPGKYFFCYRGPSSQDTWDWILSFEVGDRKVLPRKSMVLLSEGKVKSVVLSPLRLTGLTIRGVGHVAIEMGKGVHWLGEKVSVRKQEADVYISDTDSLTMRREEGQEEYSRKAREQQRRSRRCPRKVYEKILDEDLYSISDAFEDLEDEKLATEFF